MQLFAGGWERPSPASTVLFLRQYDTSINIPPHIPPGSLPYHTSILQLSNKTQYIIRSIGEVTLAGRDIAGHCPVGSPDIRNMNYLPIQY